MGPEEKTFVKEYVESLEGALKMAVSDSKEFINQVDREGLGMKTITDHRKRVEKFLGHLKKVGYTDGI